MENMYFDVELNVICVYYIIKLIFMIECGFCENSDTGSFCNLKVLLGLVK